MQPNALTSAQLEQDDKRFLWHPFTQQLDWETDPQLIIERAEGCYLFDIHGNRYLDGISSLWVNVHGHRRAEINRAIMDQLERVAHSTMLGLTHPSAIELGKRLIAIAPGKLSRVFYSDTGAAAMEIALKIAFQYWQQCDPPKSHKTKFFALHNAYHGDTIGAMSIGDIDIYRHLYRQLLFPIVQVDHAKQTDHFARLEDIERTIVEHADELAAVVMEPLIQGAAGMFIYPPGYTRAIWEIAQRNEVLFIVDEVATGFGKTGKMFACEHEGIEPDIMALAKGITGGYLPLAATLTTEEIYQAFLGQRQTFYHGHTYTGNPLACAAALANLDLFEKDQTLQQLQPKIALLTQQLTRFHQVPIVGAIRQCGFMVGIELVQDKQTQTPFPSNQKMGIRVTKEARRRGVIIRPLSDIIVLMPPLAISEEELQFLLNVVYDSIVFVQ